ncbi:MAG: hypothetical protein QOG67_507 [Verrucomicrobiota bacterium]|jgi:hypothetical protein
MFKALFIVLFPASILAAATVWEPLTKESLVGTWEAVMPMESTMVAGLYRMEIRKDAASSLVGIIALPNESPWERFMFHMTASEVADGKLKLRFHGLYEGKEAEIIFEGSGAGIGEQGAIGGRFTYSDGHPFDSFSGEMWFKKGSWTRDLERTSKEAEKLIQARHNKPKS